MQTCGFPAKKIKKKIDAWTSLCYSDMANGRA